VNVISFILCMALNATSQSFAVTHLGAIGDELDIKFQVKGWALVIWAPIYACVGTFTVYQALPSSWVKTRNNDLIYQQIGWMFPVNMLCNGLWLITFGRNSKPTFILAFIEISLMVATGVYMIWKSLRVSVNTIEFVAIRVGFSIYTAWVTAATIIGATIVCKTNGLDTNEQTWAIVMLWVALIVYLFYSFMERNPVYGAVYIWVLFAIKANAEDFGFTEVAEAVPAVLISFVLLLVIVTIYCIYLKLKGKCERGLFYLPI